MDMYSKGEPGVAPSKGQGVRGMKKLDEESLQDAFLSTRTHPQTFLKSDASPIGPTFMTGSAGLHLLCVQCLAKIMSALKSFLSQAHIVDISGRCWYVV